jgi:hypothetical protein
VTGWCGRGDGCTGRVVGGRAWLAVLAGAGMPGADELRAQALEVSRGWSGVEHPGRLRPPVLAEGLGTCGGCWPGWLVADLRGEP